LGEVAGVVVGVATVEVATVTGLLGVGVVTGLLGVVVAVVVTLEADETVGAGEAGLTAPPVTLEATVLTVLAKLVAIVLINDLPVAFAIFCSFLTYFLKHNKTTANITPCIISGSNDKGSVAVHLTSVKRKGGITTKTPGVNSMNKTTVKTIHDILREFNIILYIYKI
jgi:hypothetical protein